MAADSFEMVTTDVVCYQLINYSSKAVDPDKRFTTYRRKSDDSNTVGSVGVKLCRQCNGCS